MTSMGRRQHERGRQLMTYSIAAPARPVGRRLVGQRLAAMTGTAILTVAFAVAMSTLASAQTPAPAPAAPAAAPKPAPAKKPATPKPPAAQATPPGDAQQAP